MLGVLRNDLSLCGTWAPSSLSELLRKNRWDQHRDWALKSIVFCSQCSDEPTVSEQPEQLCAKGKRYIFREQQC